MRWSAMGVVTVALSAGCAQPAARAGTLDADVGCGKLATRPPADGEIVIDKLPLRITRPGRYVLVKDLASPHSGIAIQSGDVTIDLNGHAIRYGMGVRPTEGRGVTTYNSWQKGNIGHAGILCPARPDRTQDFAGFRWNSRFTGVVVRNGKVRDGTGAGLAYSNGIDLGGTVGAVVENVTVEVSAPDSFGVIVGRDAKVRRTTVLHTGTHVTNRHQQVADVALGPGAELSRCLLDGGPQAGVKAGTGSRIHHNLIRHRAAVTNGYGVQGYGQSNVRIFGNRIVAYNGRGIHLSEKGSGWEVRDNYVEVRERRNREYRRLQTHGIKLEGTRNSRVCDNVVLSVSSDGGEPTALNFSVAAGSNNQVYGNTFIALTVNRQGAYAAYFVGSDCAGTGIRDNTFWTNNVCCYVGPDGGRNATFRRCTFRRIGGEPVLFYANRNYKKTYASSDRFIDCAFLDGIDPRSRYFPGRTAAWRSPADYTVGWSLRLKVTDAGRAAAGASVGAADSAGRPLAAATCDERGAASIDLPEFQVVYDAAAATSTVVAPGPFAVKVAAGDKARTFTLSPRSPMSAEVDLARRGGLVLTPSSPRPGTVGEPYALPLSATGPDGAWKIAAGKLPPGLSLSEARLAGTPTRAGTYPFTLHAPNAARKAVTLKIAPTPPKPFWRKRAERALKARSPGPLGVRWDRRTDR